MIIDLRDYTTTPGNRDRLIERCETLLFLEQERLGATILGLFRDADDPNRFVWLRGMPDMETRKRILMAFYTNGEMWKANRTEVNSWIADSDDVLLLKPITEIALASKTPSIVGMYSHVKKRGTVDDAIRAVVEKAIVAAGGRLLVTFAVDSSENNYPRHPIRTGETGFVWIATFDPEKYRPLDVSSVDERRLQPTSTSRMR